MIRWTPERLAEAAAEIDRGVTSHEAARVLSERWGVAIKGGNIRAALAENRPPASTKPTVEPKADRGAGAVLVQEKPTWPKMPQAEEPRPRESARESAREQQTTQIAILSDIHIPDEDRPALNLALKVIKERQPDEVVLLGDIGEFESCSQHGASLQRYADDVAAVRGFLKTLREAAPSARVFLAEGNHESRMRRAVADLMPTLAGAHRLDLDLHLDDLGIEWVAEDAQPIHRGSLTMLHGHQLNGLPKHIAAKLAEVYGAPGRTVVMGHVHRHQVFNKPMHGGNATGVTLPCLRKLRPGWLHGSEAGWSLGFGWATVRGGRATLEVVHIEDGAAIWGGRRII